MSLQVFDNPGFLYDIDRDFSDLARFLPLSNIFRWSHPPNSALNSYQMPSDIIETEKNLIVKVQLPGIDKNNIKVKLEDNNLRISAFHSENKEEKNHKLHRVEIQRGKIDQLLKLPTRVDKNSCRASFINGILELTFDKTHDSSMKEIEIS